jgi:hypothetical protein
MLSLSLSKSFSMNLFHNIFKNYIALVWFFGSTISFIVLERTPIVKNYSCDRTLGCDHKNKHLITFLRYYEKYSWKKVLKVRVRALGLKEKTHSVYSYELYLLVYATEEKICCCGLDSERFIIVEKVCEHSYRFISLLYPILRYSSFVLD